MSRLQIGWREDGWLQPAGLGQRQPEYMAVEEEGINMMSMQVQSPSDREAFFAAASVILDTYMRAKSSHHGTPIPYQPASPAKTPMGISASLVHALSIFSLNPPPRHERVIARTAAAELLALCDKLESEGR